MVVSVTYKIKPNYYTVHEVADLLKIHWQTVLDLIKKGEISAIKLGKSYRIDEDALAAFLGSRTVGSVSLSVDASGRIDAMANERVFKDKRLVILSASFLPAADLPGIFGKGDDGVIPLIEDPPAFRHAGWDLKTLDRATPVLGEFLEVNNGARKKLRVYRDGQVVVGALADESFLGWQMEKYKKDDTNALNGVAVVEFVSNFSVFVEQIIGRLVSNPDRLLLSITIVNPRRNKIVNGFWQGMWSEVKGKAIRIARKDSLVATTMAKFDSRDVATKLWKEYGYLFGMRDDELPYLNSNGVVDFERFARES
jgi:excisionase family DNA binding protein